MEQKAKKSSLQANVLQIAWNDLKMGELLGHGGYGDVYQGNWHGTTVAIKQLYLKTVPEHLREDFVHETQVMAQCSFPQIVRLYGVCMETGHYSMVMEYMPKGSLYQVLQNKNLELSWPQRFEIAIDVGRGLSFLHSQNILHRDLKSLNILLDDQFHAKISDFGLAKIKLESSSTSTKNTKTGTVRWRAPESFKRGFKPAPSTDMYSYGMVLWEIAARQIPYADAQDELTVISWIKDGEKENIPADCPVEYGQIIQKTWEVSENRPTASDIALELEKVKPKSPPQTKQTPEKSYAPRSWHFDPNTKTAAKLQGQDYVLIPATEPDVRKVVSFYQHHPVEGYGVSKVEVIYNPGFNRGFELHLRKLQKRHNNSAFVPKWSAMQNADLRQKAYDQFLRLTSSHTDPDYPDVKLLPAWHGTRPQVLDSLFSAGYANLATTDAGFFGKGYYSAYEAEYSSRVYSKGVLILNWIASYSPLPVVNDDMQTLELEGKSNYGNYDAHFVPVKPRFPQEPAETVYYPCQSMDEQQYTEMVVFDSAALLPRYLVELGPEGLNLKSPILSSPVAQPSQTTAKSLPSMPTKVQPSVTQQPLVISTASHASPLFQPTPQPQPKAEPIYPIENVPQPAINPSTPSRNPIMISTSLEKQFGGNYSPTIFQPEPKKALNVPEQVEQMSNTAKEQNKICQEEVQALLKWVAKGHLVEVKKLLKKNPSLGVCTGTVTDRSRSDRTFKNITALQYAAWLLDREMCDLIMSYVGTDNSAIQLKALYAEPDRYSAYGDHYDIKPLIAKTKTYLKNYREWNDAQCGQYWQKEVGGEQRKCPAWLIYAWSEAGKDVAWAKQDFSRKVKREYDKNRLEWWFTEDYNNGRGVGSSWAVTRGRSELRVSARLEDMGLRYKHEERIKQDKVCQERIDSLCDELLTKLKSLSEIEYTPQVISTPVKK